LGLEYSNITDSGLATLTKLTGLQYLNLVGTPVTLKGIIQLKTLPHLTTIYLAQTAVEKKEWPSLQKAFPNAMLDSGGYQVNSLASDTTLVKAPPRK
jgi:hypothetical protein